MSWKASAWAKEQRLGSPAAKSILLCLGDYAEPERASCWPSQEQLAADAEVSERTARDWLQRLEDWGLIERQRRTGAKGARANDLIVLKLDCKVLDGTERLRGGGTESEVLPADIAGRSNRQSDADPTGNQCSPTGNQQQPSIEEPSNGTVQGTSQQAQGRERDGNNDPKKIEEAFWRMVKVWPGQRGLPKDAGLRAFAALSPDDRATAERRFLPWLALLKAQSKDHVHAPSTYFGKRLFDDVPEPTAEPAKPAYAPVFGPVWAAIRMRDLVTGAKAETPLKAWEERSLNDGTMKMGRETLEKLNRMRGGWPLVNALHLAAETRALGIHGYGPEEERLGKLCEFVPVGSDVWKAWKVEHEQRGWPWLPDPGSMPGVYFPAGGPAGLEAFEQAVRGNHDAGGREAAE
jgi:hypothetical protein